MNSNLHACLVLPFPPSVNNLFAGKTRRFKSKAYKAWLEEAEYALTQQEQQPLFVGPVSLDIALGKPDRRKRDVANLIKAVEDFIVSPANILEDDSQVQRVTAYWCPNTTGCRIYVEPVVG